jgi:hypothetical protein
MKDDRLTPKAKPAGRNNKDTVSSGKITSVRTEKSTSSKKTPDSNTSAHITDKLNNSQIEEDRGVD